MPEHDSGRCAEIFEMLSSYLDLDLPPDARRAIESHLAGCAPCVDFVESLCKTIELCRRYQPADPPAPLREDARRRILDAYRTALASSPPKVRAGGA